MYILELSQNKNPDFSKDSNKHATQMQDINDRMDVASEFKCLLFIIHSANRKVGTQEKKQIPK